MGNIFSSFIEPAIGFTGLKLISAKVSKYATSNAKIQMMIFLIAANIPAFLTNRMSYVDVAWPWGLVAIAVNTFIHGDGNTRRKLIVFIAYLIAGLRMGLGALLLLRNGHLNEELPRYLYIQNKNWKVNATTNYFTFLFKMQREILVQAAANIGILNIPAVLQSFNWNDSNNSLTKSQMQPIEYFGWLLWICGIAFEHIADTQKAQFARCKKLNLKNQVCNVGLWNYSRHPNYFGEWLVWLSLTITSIPSLIDLWRGLSSSTSATSTTSTDINTARVVTSNSHLNNFNNNNYNNNNSSSSNSNIQDEESTFSKLNKIPAAFAISLALVMCPILMYNCLVNYTGAVPAEYYSMKKRPLYKEYQKRVSIFFPLPPSS